MKRGLKTSWKLFGKFNLFYSCGHWNRVQVNKIFLEQPYPEAKVQVLIPMYEPVETTKCRRCSKIIAEPKELIRLEYIRNNSF